MLTITVQCIKHPTYKGLRKPRCNCWGCDEVYNIRWRASTIDDRRRGTSDNHAGTILSDCSRIKIGLV